VVELLAVDVRSLVKDYPGGVRGIDGLSFKVGYGEIYGLIGPNGSGKTTVLRILSTLLKPTSGRASVYGFDVVRNSSSVREIISYLPEEAGAYRGMKGREYLKFILGFRFEGRELKLALEEAESLSGLGEDLERNVKSYSKGMKRLLSLAATLAVKPKLAILDEPTAGLDVERSLEIRRAISKYNEDSGVTILLSSHNMLEVEYLCHRVGILYKGKLIAEGSPNELERRYNAKNLEEVFLSAVRGA